MQTILVIEDEEFVRLNIEEYLDMEGYRVVTADNGRKGLEIAKEVIPDLVICDINMPELDGYGVLSALRNDHATSAIPFIFLTAHAKMSELREGMQLGADDYITKPFNLIDLQQAVSSRLSRKNTMVSSVESRIQNLQHNISKAVPHELRTPLIGILGFSKILAEEASSLNTDEIQEMSSFIFESANALNHQIENYIYYAQLETIISSTEALSKYERIFISDLSETICAIAAMQSVKNGRSKDIVCEVEDALICISAEHFSKIISELIDNALKFSQSNTPITIQSAKKDNSFILTITNYSDMALEHISQLGAYMQIDRDKNEQSGSGLGIAIIRQLMKIYHGSFTINNFSPGIVSIQVSFHMAPI